MSCQIGKTTTICDPTMQVITLFRARMLTSNVRELTFATSCAFLFEPGQWVNLFFPKFRNARGAPLKRAYSIASKAAPI